MLKQFSRQAGTTLVELMISMAIGFASLTAMASLVGHGIGLNSQLLAKSRLDEEINAVAALLLSDIRRSGYDAAIVDVVIAPNTHQSAFKNRLAISHYPSEAQNSCLTFAYDHNKNGVLDVANGNENFGYRLKNKAIEMRLDGLDCDANGWHDLTDPDLIKVTQLAFTLQQQSINGLMSRKIEVTIAAELSNNSAISKQISTFIQLKNDGA